MYSGGFIHTILVFCILYSSDPVDHVCFSVSLPPEEVVDTIKAKSRDRRKRHGRKDSPKVCKFLFIFLSHLHGWASLSN